MTPWRQFVTDVCSALRAKKKTTGPIETMDIPTEIGKLAGDGQLIKDGTTYNVDSVYSNERVQKQPEEIERFNPGGTPYGIGVDASGNVVTMIKGALRKYDKERKLIWSVSSSTYLDAYRTHIAIMGNGEIFVEESGWIRKYSATGELLFAISEPSGFSINSMHGSIFDENTGAIYYTCDASSSSKYEVKKVSMSDGSFIKAIDIGDRLVASSINGNVLLCTSYKKIVRINASTLQVMSTQGTHNSFTRAKEVGKNIYCSETYGIGIIDSTGTMTKFIGTAQLDTTMFGPMYLDKQSKAMYVATCYKDTYGTGRFQTRIIKFDLNLNVLFDYIAHDEMTDSKRDMAIYNDLILVPGSQIQIIKDYMFIQPLATLKPTT